jgi:cytochrome c-type biogenesis protein CcmH
MRQTLLALALSLAALVVLASIPAGPALAQMASGQPYVDPEHTKSLIENPADKARYKQLAHELRCLVCQNQTLADSDASLAVDLRRQLETMIMDGRSDDEIKSYLVERYGEFVLYRPPMQSNTWLLWFGPFVLLAVGIGAWFLVRGGRSPAPAAGRAPQFAGANGASGAGRAKTAVRGTANPKAEGGASGRTSSGEGLSDAHIERARRLLDGDQ